MTKNNKTASEADGFFFCKSSDTMTAENQNLFPVESCFSFTPVLQTSETTLARDSSKMF